MRMRSSPSRYHPPIARDNPPFAALGLAAVLACTAPEPPAPACPPGSHPDPDRSHALRTALRRTAAGEALVAVADDPPICFGGASRGSLRPEGVIVLADSLAPGPAAARLAHMLLHLADDLHHFPIAGAPCAPQIASALAAEARAIVAEIEVWHALADADDPPYPFTRDILDAAPATRRDLVLTRLHAADPGDELAPLVRDYRDRCPGE
ncbi:hypothetical protein [Nannocystis sp.]|uniref:hypothetical protein n=1 Tax=Nannocystis sp. TaxID=1962667 RepID=UPI0025E7F711|nr:hypothetical protein [Nannocystis sp.]